MVWLLEAGAGAGAGKVDWDIHLWDCDAAAVAEAERAVTEALTRVGARGSVTTRIGDSFLHAPHHRSGYDGVITNPPWDRLKPDAREMDLLSRSAQSAHLEWLRGRSKLLATLYPWSVPSRRFAGWGVNLARCGVEMALWLVRPYGSCAIVSPASLFADQTSAPLRQLILRRFSLQQVAYFPAEAKLFEGVDQPSTTFTAQAAPPGNLISVRVHDRQLKQTDFQIDPALATEETGYTIPVHGPMECLQLLERSSSLPRFRSLELDPVARLWAGRELDETRHKDYLQNKKATRPFIKGRMVGRFELLAQPVSFVRDSDDLRLPESVEHRRVVWRDVSRPTQARRMQATVIPPGWVTGNSLNVAYIGGQRTTLLRTLLAVLNSLAFELHVRALSATAHVSLGTVRQVPIPDLFDRGFTKRLAPVVGRRLDGKREAEPLIEALVARAYGFTKCEFDLLLRAFPKLNPASRATLRSAFAAT
jgi:Alw26I/Eco31I/Esp3I family type II restriction m6 adenine DNA methyltransferase